MAILMLVLVVMATTILMMIYLKLSLDEQKTALGLDVLSWLAEFLAEKTVWVKECVRCR